jgi:mycothiol synthase
MQLSSHVAIRLYQKDDVEDIIKIIHRSMERDKFGKRVSIEEFEEALDEPNERIRENTFVSTVDNAIVAYISLCFVDNEKYIDVFSYASVDPKWRRKGIGAQLQEYVIHHLKRISKRENRRIVYNQMVNTRIPGQQELADRSKMEALTDIVMYSCSDLHLIGPPLPLKDYQFEVPQQRHAAEWAEIYNDAFSWSKHLNKKSGESVVHEFTSSVFSKDFYILCTDTDGKAIGFIASNADQETKSGRIATIAVRHSAQGLGVGKALLSEVLRRMRAVGVLNVSLNIDASNPTPALKMYERVGFQFEQRNARYALPINP